MAKHKTQPDATRLDELVGELSRDHAFAGSTERDMELRRLKETATRTDEKYHSALAHIEQLEAENRVFAALRDTPYAPPPKLPKGKEPSDIRSAAAVILCDWHCAEVVDPALLEYPNEFNLTIFRQRVQRIVEKVELLCNVASAFADIQEFHVWVIGDLMTGYLHDELMESNSIGPMEEMIEVSRQLRMITERLYESLGVAEFHVTTCHGNHSRLTRKRRYKVQHKTNMEWQLCQMLAMEAQAAGSPIKWHVAKGNMTRARVLDRWDIRLAHGDDVRYEGGIGGLSIPLLKAVKAWNENNRADYTFVGHWHQLLRLWRTVACGCLVGYNEFAQAYKCEAQPPTQTFAVFDAEKGMILCEPLFLA